VYVFDSYGNHAQTLDAWTGATLLTFGYDSSRRLTTITDAYGNVTQIIRDASGNPIGIVGPYGQKTVLTLGTDGMISQITNPAGENSRFSYTSGLMTDLYDPRNNHHQFQYESDGRLKFDGDPAGGSKTLLRTGTDQTLNVAVTTAMARVTQYASDRSVPSDEKQVFTDPAELQTNSDYAGTGQYTGQYPDKSALSLTQTADPRWSMASPYVSVASLKMPSGLAYNESSFRNVLLSDSQNPFSMTSFQQNTTINSRTYQTFYTPSTRTFALTTPQNRHLNTTLDPNGRVSQSQYGDLNAVSYQYNSRGRLQTISQGTGSDLRQISLAYDSSGFLSTLTDPLGRTVQFTYDAAGRVTTQTLPGSRTVAYDYDKSGNLTSLTPPGKTAHTFTYNTVDLPTSYTAPSVPDGGTNTTTASYNLDRQATSLLRPDGSTITTDFDPAGRTKTITFPQAQYGISYNATTGKVSSITTNNGANVALSFDGALLSSSTWSGPVTGSVGWTYDTDLRLATVSVNGSDSVSYTYDNDNLVTKAGAMTLTRSSQDGLLQSTSLDSVTDSYTYNGFGEVTGYSATGPAGSIYAVNYTRDKLGRITQKMETVGTSTTTFAYGYDAAGRLSQVSKNGAPTDLYGYDANGNRTTYNGATAGIYDAQDKLLQYQSTVFTYTPAGELKARTDGAQTTAYVYDALGNLGSVTLPDGRLIEYVIDSANRRVGKKVNGSLVKSWLYQDGLRPVAEIDSAGNITRFVYASNSNVPAYMLKAGVKYRIITDQVGSVRVVVNTTTGAPAQITNYDAFGRVLSDSNPGFQPFGFAGGLYDADTMLIRFGTRDYDPGVGRWTTKDRLGFRGGENLFGYATNNPIGVRDPLGLFGFGLEYSAEWDLGTGYASVGALGALGGLSIYNTETGTQDIFDFASLGGGASLVGGLGTAPSASWPGKSIAERGQCADVSRGSNPVWNLGVSAGFGFGFLFTTANTREEFSGYAQNYTLNLPIVTFQLSIGTATTVSVSLGPSVGGSLSNLPSYTWIR
jgi:RHS repeat-associated protein